MEEETLHVRYLVIMAAVLFVLIIGYNAFYVPDVSMPAVAVTTDVSSASSLPSVSSGEEYTPQSPYSNSMSAATGSASASALSGVSQGKINLNTATAQQLSSGLEGIGDVMAQRIIDYREKNGGFHKIEELKNVPGIGDKTFAKIQNSITVDGK